METRSMNRRGFLGGLISLIAAPAIVRVENIMPVHAFTEGVVPAKELYAELMATARRAFVPRLVVDIYKSTPLLSMLMEMENERISTAQYVSSGTPEGFLLS